MIIGTGIDLADPRRLRAACERRGERLLARLFTEDERRACERARNPWPRYAGRFAAKEAMLKAFGTGLRDGLSWQQIETTNDAAGKPLIHLTGRARALADSMGVTGIHVSISDLNSLAAATVILEGSDP
jgi:holo-[acyl-carrier protein] synthase